MFQLSTQLIVPGLAAALVSPLAEHVHYAPADGALLSRAWKVENRTDIDEFTLTLMGNEQSIGAGASRTSTVDIEVHDHIHGTAEGRPTRLDRTLVQHARDTDLADLEESETMKVKTRDTESAALEGQTVVFEWSDEARDFAPRYAEGSKGKAAWLEGLEEDMDLRAFLPEGPVEAGATWEVELAVLDQLLAPGGRLGVHDGSAADDAPEGGLAIRIPDPSAVGRYGELDGDLEVTFVGVVSSDAGRFAKLEFTAEVEGKLDIGDDLDAQGRSEGMPANEYDEAELVRTLKGKGTLLWDLGAHRMHSLEFEADTTASFTAAWAIGHGDMDFDVEVVQTSSSTLRVEATVTPRE